MRRSKPKQTYVIYMKNRSTPIFISRATRKQLVTTELLSEAKQFKSLLDVHDFMSSRETNAPLKVDLHDSFTLVRYRVSSQGRVYSYKVYRYGLPFKSGFATRRDALLAELEDLTPRYKYARETHTKINREWKESRSEVKHLSELMAKLKRALKAEGSK